MTLKEPCTDGEATARLNDTSDELPTQQVQALCCPIQLPADPFLALLSRVVRYAANVQLPSLCA